MFVERIVSKHEHRFIIEGHEVTTKRCEDEIKRMYPAQFALVFDRWTLEQTHLFSIFATFPDSLSSCEGGVASVFFLPMSKEKSSSVQAHNSYLEFVLDYHGKRWNNVATSIGDSCSTSQSLAGKANTYFIG